MRRAIGGVVLILGLGGLGYYGAKNNAVRMENRIDEAVRSVTATSVHGMKAKVQGRDIEVSGLADTLAEKERILQDLDGVAGRRIVRDDLEVLPLAAPFRFSAQRDEAGQVQVSGDVPTEKQRASLASTGLSGVEDLHLSAGAPEGWPEAVMAGVQALAPLETGELHLSDQHLTLSGTARSPLELEQLKAHLTQLPAGYTQELAIDLLEDGKPVAYSLRYSAGEGASIEGKLPAGLTQEALAEAMGLAGVTGAPRTALQGDPQADLSAFEKLSDWLPLLENFTLNAEENRRSWQVELPKGGDAELVAAGLQDVLEGDVSVAIIDPASLPAEGTVRFNQGLQAREVLRAGYWLPEVDFEVSEGECNARGQALVNSHKVNFLSGSARLDARASRAINQMSAVVLRCVQEAGQHVEVGGHTDNQGGSALNMTLSQARAEAVRVALIQRGVPASAITAVGYGETRPVADNSTTQGRAANRRTTLAFSQ